MQPLNKAEYEARQIEFILWFAGVAAILALLFFLISITVNEAEHQDWRAKYFSTIMEMNTDSALVNRIIEYHRQVQITNSPYFAKGTLRDELGYLDKNIQRSSSLLKPALQISDTLLIDLLNAKIQIQELQEVKK